MRSKNIFVNLPVADLAKSMAFFRALGFEFNMDYTDETAACMVIGEHIYAMLVTREKFAGFTNLPVADAHSATEVLVAVDRPSREAVDEAVRKAVEAGGKVYAEPQDHGWMYYHSFADLDGHRWEMLYINT